MRFYTRWPRLRGVLAFPGPREKNAKVGALRGTRLAYAPTAPCIAFSVINLCLPTLLCCFALGSRTSRQCNRLLGVASWHGVAVSGKPSISSPGQVQRLSSPARPMRRTKPRASRPPLWGSLYFQIFKVAAGLVKIMCFSGWIYLY